MTPTTKRMEQFAAAVARVEDEDMQHLGEAPADGTLLTGGLRDAYATFRAAAKMLEAVTLKARNDIELAQQKYREALAEFTRLSVADEG